MKDQSYKGKHIAGMSLKGGRRDNFYFSLIRYYEDQDRWFLKSLLQVKDDEEFNDGDEAIRRWIDDYEVTKMVIDFPLSTPKCQTCVLKCPGMNQCPVYSVVEVKKKIKDLIEDDNKLYETHHKEYERKRNEDDLFNFNKDILAKDTLEHILSKSFKRKLKKGFLPYWNRSIDFYIWAYFHDPLLKIFNTSYDSFGNTSLMTVSRFSYLRRHFPHSLELFEGNNSITLIELFRTKVITKKDLINLSDLDLVIEARLDIIKRIEKRLNLFIYDDDLEILTKQQRAFESFILAVNGMSMHLGKVRELPDWTLPEETKFIIPDFSQPLQG